MKKQAVSVAALLRPVSRGIHIRCSNQPRWKGIKLSNHPHAIHRLGRTHFAGLARNSILEKIFPNEDNVIRVELTDDGALIKAEGTIRLSTKNRAERKVYCDAPLLVPYDHRVRISFGEFTLKVESA